MSARRQQMHRPRSQSITGAVSRDYGVQFLERRLMLTTLTAGPGETGTFEYEAEGGGVMRIYYSDVTFEAIGVSVNPMTDQETVGDLIPAGITPPVAPLLPFNLFTIYVTQSAPDSFITVAPVARLTAAPTGIRADLPFGAGQPLTVNPADNLGVPYAVTPGAGIGAGVLGAFTFGVKNVSAADVPITEVPDPGVFGVYPGNAFGDGFLHAGLDVPADASGAPQSLEAFKFAGEVFGQVAISGNIQLFYAGALLTGDATGISLPGGTPTSASSITPNFTIGGDIRDLVTSGDIGGDVGNAAAGAIPNYDTGFSAVISGKVGEVYELNGGFFGSMDVKHSASVVGLTDSTPEQELEYQNTGVFIIGDPGGIGQIFQGDNGYLSTLLPDQLPAPFTNNTAATAQYLGTSRAVDAAGNVYLDTTGNPAYDTQVTGTLQNGLYSAKTGDPADWYAVSMLAGVPMTISVTGGDEADILVELEDPDGRVVASDVQATATGTLGYTTDRPGIYKIGLRLLPGLSGVDLPYTLTITGTGNEGFGELAAGGDVSDMELDGFLEVDNGDFGGVISGAYILSGTAGPTELVSQNPPLYAQSSIIVARGDLRTVMATSIGSGTAGTLDGLNNSTGVTIAFPLTLSVPNGNVGLVDATGTLITDVLTLETQYDPSQLDLGVYKTDDLYAHAIGGNIQVINAGSTFYGMIATNAGIGTIRAAAMDTTVPSHIDVNADNTGNDGIIDLIDVSGQFGVLGGGPAFVTNTGGNIRYLNLPDTGAIYLPAAFGGGDDFPVVYPIGATETFTDDSGAQFTLSSPDVVTTVQFNNSNGTVTNVSEGTQITVLSYPVLDHAGLVPISITAQDSTGGNVSSGSLILSGTGINGADSEVDVANITITGEGRAITPASAQTSTGATTPVTDAYGNVGVSQPVPTNGSTGMITSDLDDPSDEFLLINGPAKFNVLNTTATVFATFAGNSPVEIDNNTRGEMVNVTAPGLGSLIVNGNLGFATPQATAAAVFPSAVIANGNVFPFVQQHTGVVIGTGFVVGGVSGGTTGDIVNIDVGGAAGNIQAGGTIQSLITNYAQSTGVKGSTAIPGQLDGIIGPVLATRLLYVDVGQGLTPSGSGMVGLSGLYATGKIGLVTNAGNPNGDIRGNIISAEDFVDGEAVASYDGIDAITVNNASIIGNEIETIDDNAGAPQFIESSYLYTQLKVPKDNGQNFAPGISPLVYDVGPVTVTGDGGILGTQFSSGSFASITVGNGGFGIINVDIDGQPNGRIGSISASGYGIRDSIVRNIGYLGPVSATGSGALIPVTNYPIDVRPSDVANALDPFYGLEPTKLTDLDAVLGTSAQAPNIPGRTDTGVIEDDIFNGLNDFSGLAAQKARTILPVVTTNTLPIPSVLNIPVIGTTFTNSITFGGVVGNVNIRQEIDGLQITCGKLLGLSLSSSVNRLGVSVAGNIAALIVRGNLGAFVTDPETGISQPDSYINAAGADGTIGLVRVLGNLNANVYSTGEIGSVIVNGDLEGGIIAYGAGKSLALGTLHVLGGIRDGSLILHGSVGSIIVNGTFGTAAGNLSIAGNCNLISVGANHRIPDTSLSLNLFVAGTLKTLMVHGTISGSVHTGIDLTRLIVINNGGTPNAITGAINVDGRLGSATITGGSITSAISVTGNIGSFTLNNGNLNAGASVNASVGSISLFRTLGGGSVFGTIYALNSNNGTINISGNVGDGVNAATIVANSAVTFHIHGNINAHADLALTQALNLLQVDGSVFGGATISAHPLKKQKIAGINDGTIVSV